MQVPEFLELFVVLLESLLWLASLVVAQRHLIQ
jgi:hypothetical protein